MGVTIERAIELIVAKREAEAKASLKKFDEDPEMEVKDGRFGPYVAYKGVNYKLTKAQAARATELTYEECLKHVEAENEKKKKKK
jgi:DNA topoisomerase-1